SALGLRVLRRLGIDVPARFDAAGGFLGHLPALCQWVAAFDPAAEAVRRESQDARVIAAASMIARLVSSALLSDREMLAWLLLLSRDLWQGHGPCAPLMVSFSRIGTLAIVLADDWHIGSRAPRLALDLCESRGWQAEAI